jgi:hypothetical protein
MTYSNEPPEEDDRYLFVDHNSETNGVNYDTKEKDAPPFVVDPDEDIVDLYRQVEEGFNIFNWLKGE